MVGEAAAEGRITAFGNPNGQSTLSGSLGSGGSWGATIRSGTCAEPGPVEHIVGPIENGQINAVVDEPLDNLVGRIIVMTPLGSDVTSACGVLAAP